MEEYKLDQLSLKEKIGQMILRPFIGQNDLSEELKEINNNGELGGVILFSGFNVFNAEQVKSLCHKIQSNSQNSIHKIPYFIAIDQEGGQLSPIYDGLTVFPGNNALGVANSIDLAYKNGLAVSKQLSELGININTAPVLDCNFDIHNSRVQNENRAISDDPQIVAELGSSFVKGAGEIQGILNCGKHFPGQRPTLKDTHHELDVVDYSIDRLNKVELLPFKSAIKSGLDSIMTSHAIYSSMDELPATLSKKWLDHLRRDLNFEGLIISDDIMMAAIEKNYGAAKAVTLAINAGVNLLIITNQQKWIVPHILNEVKNGNIDIETINNSVNKILEYKNKLFSKVESNEKTKQYNYEEIAASIAKKSITLNKFNLKKPVQNIKNQSISVILGTPARLVMSDTTNLYNLSLRPHLEKAGFLGKISEVIMPLNPTEEEIISISDIGLKSDLCIFCTVNAFNYQKQVDILKSIRLREDINIIGVALRSPEDLQYLNNHCEATLATHGLTNISLSELAKKIFDLLFSNNLTYEVSNSPKIYASYSFSANEFLNEI